MFSERLKKIRIKKGISQEALADKLNVSRQSISKYEQGVSFPDYEKLTILVNYFDVSFDYLLGDDSQAFIKESATPTINGNNRIAIISDIDGSLSSYYKFSLAKTFRPKEWSPRGMLMGVDSTSFWGDSGRPLGWYATVEEAQKEMKAIYQAISQNKSSYDLAYSVRVKKKGLVDVQIDWD